MTWLAGLLRRWQAEPQQSEPQQAKPQQVAAEPTPFEMGRAARYYGAATRMPSEMVEASYGGPVRRAVMAAFSALPPDERDQYLRVADAVSKRFSGRVRSDMSSIRREHLRRRITRSELHRDGLTVRAVLASSEYQVA